MGGLRRQIQMVAAGYEWTCVECGTNHKEKGIPFAPDLRCQECGAHYELGRARHLHCDAKGEVVGKGFGQKACRYPGCYFHDKDAKSYCCAACLADHFVMKRLKKE